MSNDDDNRDWFRHWMDLETELGQSPTGKATINPQNPAQKIDRGEKEERESGEHIPNRPSADFAALIHAIKREGIAYRKEEQREDRGKKFREWTTIGLIFATFIAVCWQVHEMVKVYGPISEQAQAARDSAKANVEAAQAATKQSENSDKALIEGQRAWVGPSNAQSDGDPIAGKSYDVIITYQNTGREPATENIFDFLGFTEDIAQDPIITEKVTSFLNACINRWQPGGGSVVYACSRMTSSAFLSVRSPRKAG
jgi:hypothetical protein